MTEKRLKEKTVKGILWGGMNNGFQQILNLVIGIFLARILTPEDYGVVGVLTVFSATASALQEGGFVSAINNKKQINQSELSSVFWFSLGCSVICYWILFFCAPYIALFYSLPELTHLSRFIFIGFVFSSLAVVPRAILFKGIRAKEAALISALSLLFSGVVAIVLSVLGYGYWALAVQTVTYTFFVAALSFAFTRWYPAFEFKFRPIKTMLIFGIKIVASNVFSIFNNNILAVLLGRFYNAADVGDYNQANKWTTIGYSLISGTIYGVAQPAFAKVIEDAQRLKRVFRKMLRFTAMVSFPAMLGLSFIAKDFIVLTISAKWLYSASIMEVVCVWGAFFPISYLFSNLLLSQGRSKAYMWSTIALCIVQICAVYFSKSLGLFVMVWIFVGINILWTLVWFILVRRRMSINFFEVLKDITPYMMMAVVSIVPSYFLTVEIEPLLLRLFLKIILTAVFYLTLLYASGSKIFREGLEFFVHKRIT